MAHDIGTWLETLELGGYAEVFEENGVDLRALPHLTEDDLRAQGDRMEARRRWYRFTIGSSRASTRRI